MLVLQPPRHCFVLKGIMVMEHHTQPPLLQIAILEYPIISTTTSGIITMT